MNIALVGTMASGKSHAANFLINKYNYTHITLAEPIKLLESSFESHPEKFSQEAWLHLGAGKVLDNEDLWKFIEDFKRVIPTIPRELPKPRSRYQYIGTELGRNKIRNDIWIEIAANKIRSSNNKKFVIDDIRFENEVIAFKKLGFVTIKLNVSDTVQLKRLKTLYNFSEEQITMFKTHQSEKDIKNLVTDFEVDADQNLIDMYQDIEKIIESE